MTSPAPSSFPTAPRKTLPLPTTTSTARRATSHSLHPNRFPTSTSGTPLGNGVLEVPAGGSVQTTTVISRSQNRDTPPEPLEIERGLEEMIGELEELEEVLGRFFDGVINTPNPETDLHRTKQEYDKAITRLTHLIQLAKSTSLGGVPLITNHASDPSRSVIKSDSIPTTTTTTTTTTSLDPAPTLSTLIQTIEKASGESYSRLKVVRDEVRGVGEVLSR